MAQGKETPGVSKGGSKTERISAVSTGAINTFSASTVTSYAGLMSNAVAEYYANDKNRIYATQRPALQIESVASTTVGDTKGRGIHYWSSNDTLYFMNDDVIYKGTYTAPCSVQGGDTAISSGSSQVHFLEWSSANADYLFIFDAENDGIYVISSLADTTVINLANRSGSGTLEGFAVGDSWDFDALNTIISSDGLCEGAVDLDTYCFIGTLNSARIYNSNVDDWLNWDALNFTTCERSNDKLLFIEKTKEHIAAFGERSIELYYDNQNATGSPLSNRTDIAHQIGVAFQQAAWTNGDDIHFLGVKPGGEYVLSTLKDFQVVPHENPTLSAYMWQSRYTEDLTINMSGFSVGGHIYVVMTMLNGQTPVKSVVYDAAYDFWYEWSTTLGTNTMFTLMGYAQRDYLDNSRPAGILRTGDIFYIDSNYIPIDSIDEVGSEATENITMQVITDNFDANSTNDKFMSECKYVGNQPTVSTTLTVAWTDDDGVTSASQTIDLTERDQVNRMGKFTKRKFTLTLAAAEQIRMEGIDVTFTQGSS